ncbi:MAG TPA: RNA polymerase sigma factor [Anaerolineales bacterium]|nr:RNA polymerase sigma factor [Anaerolineales bacterium]
MENISTRELVEQMQAGSLEALGALYDRYHPMVYRTALGITSDTEAASDLLQDVFLRMHRFADKIDVNRPLEPWLYRVTVNLACSWAKRQKWLRPIEELAEWLSGDQRHSPVQMMEKNETRGNIEKAIATLPLSHRTVIVMYYVNELSLQEIADILTLPVGTVKSRLHYGRHALKQEMDVQNGHLLNIGYEFT